MNRMIRCLVSLFLIAGFVLADEGSPAPPETVAFVPNEQPFLELSPRDGAIVIDGNLNDSGWIGAARADNFVETWPGDLVRPSVGTEVWVTYDTERLYVAFVAEDDPATVRATLRDRDEIFKDDYVGILLDTYGDAALSYEIFVNPIGIQGDLRLTKDGEDISFDMIFESRGRITENGYQVEVAIPFSSLRFPNRDEQVWRVNFWRDHPRDSRRRYSWSTISRDDPCFPCQWGTITGIRNVEAGTSLELLPSVVGSQSSALADEDDLGSAFRSDDPEGEASLGVRYSFTPSITGEVTLNPDFSQVESDADQVDVNSTFALFFPEKRPFFQEGGDLFGTWVDVVYTRSINDPSLAAKLTGRHNGFSVGYLAARDETTPTILPFEERSAFVASGASTSNILRMRQTFGQESYVAAIATDRRMEEGGAATVMGVDGQLRFLRNYQFEWQAVFSRTAEPTDTALTEDVNDLRFDGTRTAAFDGETFWGNAGYASLEYDSRIWDWDIDYWQYSPTFRADNGFVTRNNYRQVNLYNDWNFNFDDHPLLTEFSPQISVARIWNFDGRIKDEWLNPSLFINMRKQTYIFANAVYSNENFKDIQFDGIWRVGTEIGTRASKVLNGGLWFSYGNSIARNEDVPVLGENYIFLNQWGTFRPLNRLVIEPSFTYTSLDHPDTGDNIFSGYILRTRFNVQFTREFFLRMVVQYNDFNERVSVEPLLTYRINPFSLFYVGSTHALANRDLRDGRDLVQTERQIFFKFQYLFQL